MARSVKHSDITQREELESGWNRRDRRSELLDAGKGFATDRFLASVETGL